MALMGSAGPVSAYSSAPPVGIEAVEMLTLSEQPPDTNDFMDLERDVTSCISSNPLPGCGRQPTSSGDRGGWQQLLLFAIMFAGMSIIFWRVYLAVRLRDRQSDSH
jgi:hypothetical protein